MSHVSPGSPAAKGRFTISKHQTSPLHWDLFLERGGVLKTWSLPAPPEGPGDLPAIQHFDHRLVYLDYEGEISGGRGVVKRWDTGTFEADWGETRIRIVLTGARVRGEFLLEFVNPAPRSEWRLRRI